jgi:hypothetical protein
MCTKLSTWFVSSTTLLTFLFEGLLRPRPVLYKADPNRSVSSVPSLSVDFVARPSWTGCTQLDFRPHCSRGADPAFVRQEYITRQSRVAVLSLRLQGCAGASRLGERAARERVRKRLLQPCCCQEIPGSPKVFAQNPKRSTSTGACRWRDAIFRLRALSFEAWSLEKLPRWPSRVGRELNCLVAPTTTNKDL